MMFNCPLISIVTCPFHFDFESFFPFIFQSIHFLFEIKKVSLHFKCQLLTFIQHVDLRLIPKRRFAQNHFKHTDKEVRPKRSFGSPKTWKLCSFNSKLISLKWHILTPSPLFEKQHISLYFKVKITRNNSALIFNLQNYIFRDWQIFNNSIVTHQDIIIPDVNNRKTHFRLFNFRKL